MEKNFYVRRIQNLLEERDWSMYKLAQESGLAKSSIHNLSNNNNAPTITTLEKICQGFGITFEQFFCENGYMKLTNEQKTVLTIFTHMDAKKREIFLNILKEIDKL